MGNTLSLFECCINDIDDAIGDITHHSQSSLTNSNGTCDYGDDNDRCRSKQRKVMVEYISPNSSTNGNYADKNRIQNILPDVLRQRYTIKWVIGSGSTSKVYEVEMKNPTKQQQQQQQEQQQQFIGTRTECNLGSTDSFEASTTVDDDYSRPILSPTYGNTTTAIYRACKVIDKRKLSLVYGIHADAVLQQLKQEIDVLRGVDHPNIVAYYEYYETKASIIIIMERCDGDDLFDYILDSGPLDEQSSHQIITQILLAVSYLHARGIIHRDIKAENIIIYKSSVGTYSVKLIDFGFSIILGRNLTGSFLGTGGYIAPEMRRHRQYSMPVDIWSCGILLYYMLSGQLPFTTSTENLPNDLSTCEKTFLIKYPVQKWSSISQGCKNFLQSLLDVNPIRRISALQALSHPWGDAIKLKSNTVTITTATATDDRIIDQSNDESDKSVVAVNIHSAGTKSSNNSVASTGNSVSINNNSNKSINSNHRMQNNVNRLLIPTLTSPLRPIQSVSAMDKNHTLSKFMRDLNHQSFNDMSVIPNTYTGTDNSSARTQSLLTDATTCTNADCNLQHLQHDDFYISSSFGNNIDSHISIYGCNDSATIMSSSMSLH